MEGRTSAAPPDLSRFEFENENHCSYSHPCRRRVRRVWGHTTGRRRVAARTPFARRGLEIHLGDDWRTRWFS